MSTQSDQLQEINSNCPYCNSELEEGYLITNGPRLLYSEKKQKLFYTVDEKDILIDKHKLGAYHKSYICRNCKKIIIDFKDDNVRYLF